MAEQLRVFVSHSHEDDAFCRAVVQTLRGAGADVWYDEHNMGSGQLLDTIDRELRERPIFILILTPAAVKSAWVRDECKWAYTLLRRDPSRLILPVTASAGVEEHHLPLYLQDFKRIEAPGLAPYLPDDAARRLARTLGLTPRGEAPAPVAPQATESVDDLLARGKALMGQKKYAEALPLFERATQLAPGSFDAWANKSASLGNLRRNEEALAAYDQALAIDDNQAWVLTGRGEVLRRLGRYQEALSACDRALALDPNNADAWTNQGAALYCLKRYDEALAACDRALALDPNLAQARTNQGAVLNDLKRYDEALAACDRALALDPNYANAWVNKGVALGGMGRNNEAITAYERALSLDPTDGLVWKNKANRLRALGRTAEAEAAEKRARELGWKG